MIIGETPDYLLNYIKKEFFKNNDYLDPCPLYAKFNGLNIEWERYNFINPPYNRKDKEAFIRKSLEESNKGKFCVMLLPVSTETKIFHDIIIPNALVIFLYRRVKFKGYNSKNEYVTNKSGQSGSMLVVFGEGFKGIKTLKIEEDKDARRCKKIGEEIIDLSERYYETHKNQTLTITGQTRKAHFIAEDINLRYNNSQEILYRPTEKT